MTENEKHEFHIAIERDIFDKLEAIKDYHGIKNITEIIRFLITKEHREIKKSKWFRNFLLKVIIMLMFYNFK